MHFLPRCRIGAKRTAPHHNTGASVAFHVVDLHRAHGMRWGKQTLQMCYTLIVHPPWHFPWHQTFCLLFLCSAYPAQHLTIHGPRINPKHSVSLRECSDFLIDFWMPAKIGGLMWRASIFWMTAKRIKIHTEITQLDWSWNQDFPTFQESAAFVAAEAQVACNPVISFYVLCFSETSVEKQNLKQNNRGKVRVLNT